MNFLRLLIPRIENILLTGIFLGIAASGPRLLNFDGDLPRHILTGMLTLQSGSVATTDVFSFRTTGHPSFPHEWLSQVIIALAYQWLGLSGVVILTAILITVTWGLVFQQSQRRSGSLLSALVVVVLGVAASQIHVLPRPHIFTYLMIPIWIAALERADDTRRHGWLLLPILMLLWVNMHGMFVIGIIILGLHVTGGLLDLGPVAWLQTGRARSLLAGGGLALAATLFSPSGPQIWAAIASLGSNSYITSRISEYQSADFHLPETWPFLIMLLVLIVTLGRMRRPSSWTDILILVIFAGLAIHTSRMIPLFAIVAAPIAAGSIASWARAEFPQSRFHIIDANLDRLNQASNGFVWLLLVFLFVTIQFRAGRALDPEHQGNRFSEPFFPVNAVSWLRGHPQEGHVLNEFDWGGYLLFRLWPEKQIFMDGHTHIYGESLTREYEQVTSLSAGWEAVLAKYDIQWAILRARAPLAAALADMSDWELIYEDPVAVVLRKRPP